MRSSDTISDKNIGLHTSFGDHFRYFVLGFWSLDDDFRGIEVKKIKTGSGKTRIMERIRSCQQG